ncbi:MAG: hypothetical protein IJL11_07745 [Synergistaceae bacterium]|nr:hypothetical protein [Synergistaceae bacterium]
MTAEQKDRAKTTRMLKKYASETSWILRIYRDAMSFMTDEEYMTEYGYNPRVSDKVEEYLFNGEWNGTPEFANCFDYARSLLPERYWNDESESIPMIADIVARIGSRLAEETMTAQAVEAIRTADTVEAIAVVFQECAKIKDMSAVFESVVGDRYYGKTVAIKKDELAWNMAYQLMRRRENEAFKALSVSDKLRKLCAMDAYATSRYVHQCEIDELREIACALGVKVEESEDEFILKVQLDYQDAIVKELIARADDKADDTETSQPEALYEDDAYADDGGDNSAHEQDIPECHEPDATPAPVNLEEIYAETEQFEKMPVSEKMKYLKAIAEIYHSQPIHDDYYGLDCGFYDLFRHCTVNELEEIARISGVKIPASVYVDKGVLDINLQWYVNVKVFGVDTTPTELDYVKDADYWSETPEKAKANNNPAMLYDWLEAEIENYECGKLTAEEMSEIVKYAPLGTLRTYARMNEIAPLMSNDEREGLKRAITARIFLPADNISKNEGEITAMLNKYAENRATRRAILDGMRFFWREIQKRTEKGLSSEKLPEAILSVKKEYRRLRLEGFQLRRKLLRVICAEEISQACAKYVARCREIQRRRTGK